MERNPKAARDGQPTNAPRMQFQDFNTGHQRAQTWAQQAGTQIGIPAALSPKSRDANRDTGALGLSLKSRNANRDTGLGLSIKSKGRKSGYRIPPDPKSSDANRDTAWPRVDVLGLGFLILDVRLSIFHSGPFLKNFFLRVR